MERVCAILLIFATVLAVPGLVLAGSGTRQNTAVHRLELEIQTQLERIRYAKEAGSAAMTLARLRVAEQLSRAEQELERNLANLERLKESLANHVSSLEASCGESPGEESKGVISSALSRLQAQIRETDALISRMEAFRNDVEEPVIERSTGDASTSGLWGLDDDDVSLGTSNTTVSASPMPVQPWIQPSTSPGAPPT